MQSASNQRKPAPILLSAPAPVTSARQTKVGAPYLVALLTPRSGTSRGAVPSTTTCTPGRKKFRPAPSAWKCSTKASPILLASNSRKRSTSALLSSSGDADRNKSKSKRIKLVHGSKSASPPASSRSIGSKPSITRKYEAAMARCAQASPSRLRKSLDLLREMQSRGIRPSAHAFHGLISACISNGQTVIARSILKRMVLLRTEHDRRGDHRIYNALIKICMKLGDADMAFGLIQLMGQSSTVQITTGSVDILLKVCDTVGNKSHVQEAVDLFSRLQVERGMKADRMLIDTMLQTCFSKQVYTNILTLTRVAIRIGMYKPFPLGTAGSMCMWDLHNTIEMDACFLLAEAFDRAAVHASQGVVRDVVIVTGKGLGSKNAPVLRYALTSDSNSSADPGWTVETSMASYEVHMDIDDESVPPVYSNEPVTTESRVAGTQFAIELPLEGSESNLKGSLGFVLSGDGSDHGPMVSGELHAFYPAGNDLLDGPEGPSSSWWRQLPPHPGYSRWAPGSFVMRGTARTYFMGGYDRALRNLYSDLWMIDLSGLFLSLDEEQGDVEREIQEETSTGDIGAGADIKDVESPSASASPSMPTSSSARFGIFMATTSVVVVSAVLHFSL